MGVFLVEKKAATAPMLVQRRHRSSAAFLSQIDQTISIYCELKKMASTKDGIIFNYGFESIYNIFKYIPILYPLLPIMFVLKHSYIGNLIYNELAVKRKIIPITCDDKCEI